MGPGSTLSGDDEIAFDEEGEEAAAEEPLTSPEAWGAKAGLSTKGPAA